MKENESGGVMEADCFWPRGQYNRMIFRPIALSLHDGRRRYGCQMQNVIFWLEFIIGLRSERYWGDLLETELTQMVEILFFNGGKKKKKTCCTNCRQECLRPSKEQLRQTRTLKSYKQLIYCAQSVSCTAIQFTEASHVVTAWRRVPSKSVGSIQLQIWLLIDI